MDKLLDIDTTTIEDLDFDPDLPCDGARHSEGFDGHVPDQPATWRCVKPCSGTCPSYLLCDGRIRTLSLPQNNLVCHTCNTKYAHGEWHAVKV